MGWGGNMDRKIAVWNEELFYQSIKFADKQALMLKIVDAENKEEKFQVKLNHHYPLFKDLFGVKIEYGNLRLQKILLNDALDILNTFISPVVKKNKIEFIPIVNVEGIEQLGIYLDLEKPHRDSIQGYIINGELIKIETEPQFTIIMKYKDSPDNIFYIYKLYFLEYLDELFLVVEKNI